METNASTNRKKFLKDHGIGGDQALVVHAVNQIQAAVVARVDETCIKYLRGWVPELRGRSAKSFGKWLSAHDCVFSATGGDQNKITGWHTLVYCFFRKNPELKRAMKVSYRVIPVPPENANVRLEFESEQIPFPPEIKITGLNP